MLNALVGDEAFARQEFDESYVLLHYFAFLERDPDAEGYALWLGLLKKTGDREMITRSFSLSPEYRFSHPKR